MKNAIPQYPRPAVQYERRKKLLALLVAGVVVTACGGALHVLPNGQSGGGTGVLAVLRNEDGSLDARVSQFPEYPEQIGEFYFQRSYTNCDGPLFLKGLFRIWSIHFSWHPRAQSVQLTPSEIAIAESKGRAWLAALESESGKEDPEMIALIKSGDAQRWRLRWENFPVLVARVLCLGLGIAVLVVGANVLVLRRRIRRISHGLCERCAYDLHGLGTATCPECGHVAN